METIIVECPREFTTVARLGMSIDDVEPLVFIAYGRLTGARFDSEHTEWLYVDENPELLDLTDGVNWNWREVWNLLQPYDTANPGAPMRVLGQQDGTWQEFIIGTELEAG